VGTGILGKAEKLNMRLRPLSPGAEKAGKQVVFSTFPNPPLPTVPRRRKGPVPGTARRVHSPVGRAVAQCLKPNDHVVLYRCQAREAPEAHATEGVIECLARRGGAVYDFDQAEATVAPSAAVGHLCHGVVWREAVAAQGFS
jgi:hypothetical protein